MEENKDLTVKYENYRKTLSLKENELKGYEEYFKTLKDQHDIAKFQVAAIKTESKEPSSNILEENLENSSSLNIDIIQTNELMNSQIATLTTEIKQLQRLNSQLSENLSCKSVEFELLVHNLHKIEQEFELYKNENSLNIEQIKIISKSKEKLAFENLANIKEISLLGSYIDELNEKLNKVETSLKIKTENEANYEETIKKLTKNLNECTTDLKFQTDSNAQLNSDLSLSLDANAQLKFELSSLLDANKWLKSELASSKDLVNTEIIFSNDSNKLLQSEIASLNESIKILEFSKNKLLAQLNNANTIIAEYKNNINNLTQTIILNTKERERLENELNIFSEDKGTQL